MLTPDEAQALTLRLFGPPGDAEVAKLWGCMSSLPAAARALGGGLCLPALPPREQDVSLRYDAECVARRVHTYVARRHSRYRGVTKQDRIASANASPQERTQDA